MCCVWVVTIQKIPLNPLFESKEHTTLGRENGMSGLQGSDGARPGARHVIAGFEQGSAVHVGEDSARLQTTARVVFMNMTSLMAARVMPLWVIDRGTALPSAVTTAPGGPPGVRQM